MHNDRRHSERFEPDFFDVEIKYQNKYQVRGRILDSSFGGLAAALPDGAELPDRDSKVKLSAVDALNENIKINIGSALVTRCWSDDGLYDNGSGISLRFDKHLDDDKPNRCLVSGIRQRTRLNSQAKLVVADLNYLGDYRRDLAGCQMKLFSIALTVCVALAGAYFALTYQSILTNQLSNPDLSFWRTMVAALPGCLSIACALVVAQKSISMQRLDAYLAVLKDFMMRGKYPREYRGWETDYRKFRNILNTDACTECAPERKCGNLKNEDQEQLDKRKMFRASPYYIVIYMSFLSVLVLSVIAVVIELVKFQWGVPLYMAVASVITSVFVVVASGFLYVFYNLRKGKYSISSYKRCWIDLLNRCRQPI